MRFKHLETNEIIFEQELRERCAGRTYFPSPITEACLQGFPWEIVAEEPLPEPTAQEVFAQYENAINDYYQSKAALRRYDNKMTILGRCGYAGPYQAECIEFAHWLDACCAYGYQVEADCLAGVRTLPTINELITELPACPWG